MVFGILATCILDNTFKSYENLIFHPPLDLRILYGHIIYIESEGNLFKSIHSTCISTRQRCFGRVHQESKSQKIQAKVQANESGN